MSTLTNSTQGGSGGSTALRWVFLTAAVVLGIGYARHQYADATKRAEAEKAAAQIYAAAHRSTPPVVPEYPISGSGHATKEVGIKAYLDPMKTYLRPSRAVRYVFVEDTAVFFDEDYAGGIEPNSTPHRKVWLGMPAGKYLVYSLVEGKVYFRWWQ